MKRIQIDINETSEILKKQDVLVSIVIPVYNVEKYLERCLDSVLEQNYKNLEIILVDDGSKDNSGEIAERYAQTDNRIKVIHQDNSGQSYARNVGIENANGEYIAFVDSDDYISKDYISVMIMMATKLGCDIVQTKVMITEKEEPVEDTDKKSVIEANITSPGKFAVNDFLYKVAVYAKLYRKEIFKDSHFPTDLKIYEDDATYYKFAYAADKICIANYYTYYYYQSPYSVMRYKNDKKTDYIQVYYDRIKFYEDRNEKELVLGSRERFCLVLLLSYADYLKAGTNSKDLERMAKIFKEQYKFLNKYKIGFVKRVAYAMFCRMPDITAKLIGIVK